MPAKGYRATHCKRGHERTATNVDSKKSCKLCAVIHRHRGRNAPGTEGFRDYCRAYRIAHREICRERTRKWRSAHLLLAREGCRKWMAANRAELLKKKLAWYYKSKEKTQWLRTLRQEKQQMTKDLRRGIVPDLAQLQSLLNRLEKEMALRLGSALFSPKSARG